MFGGGGLEVQASQDSYKYAGAFQLRAEGVSGVRAEQLEQAIYEVLDDLRENPVPDEELQKVKNQLRVENIRFMDLMSGIGILFYVGQNAAMGDWTEVNHAPEKREAVTAADLQRVAQRYFKKDQRNVLIINPTPAEEGREAGGGEDPRFTQAVQMIQSSTDPAQLEMMIGMFSARMGQIEDPEQQERMERLLKIAADRLQELKAAESE
jgi:hypothetical protein